MPDTPVSGRPQTPLYQAIDALADSVQSDLPSFGTWPLALQAQYSQTVAPQVRAIVQSGDLTDLINGEGPDLFVLAASTYTYGVPGTGDLPKEQALALAKQALEAAYGLDSDTVARYEDVSVYFDVSDADAPLWKFVFQARSARDFVGVSANEPYKLVYRVELNARTGEVQNTEQFARELLGYDLDYMLKLY